MTEDINWQGGWFFKYYELEQYEQALANYKYEDGDLLNSPSNTPYKKYVFMKGEEMLKALEIDYDNEKIKIDLTKLYPNIDIAETLSNLTGKLIKKINDNALTALSLLIAISDPKEKDKLIKIITNLLAI